MSDEISRARSQVADDDAPGGDVAEAASAAEMTPARDTDARRPDVQGRGVDETDADAGALPPGEGRSDGGEPGADEPGFDDEAASESGDAEPGDSEPGDSEPGDGVAGDGVAGHGVGGEPGGAVPEPSVPAFPDDPTAEDWQRLSDAVLALLFATEQPLTAARLAHAAGITTGRLRQAIAVVEARIEEQRLPFRILEIGGQYRLVTAAEFHPYLLRLQAVKKAERLSPAALETLAVVAYRQPVIRAEIEAIRGVKAGPVLRHLLDRRLIRVAGRKDVPGRPVQYEVTREFLDRFGIRSTGDLPTLGELKRGQI